MTNYHEDIKKAGYRAEWFKDPENWKNEIRQHETVCRQLDAGRYKAIDTGNLIRPLARSDQIQAVDLINAIRASSNAKTKDFIASKVWCSKAGWYHGISEIDYLERSGFWKRSKPDPESEYCWQTWEP